MTDRPQARGRRRKTAGHLLAHIDGGARGNPGPAGYGVSIQGPSPEDLYGFIGVATNNTAEYAALLALLEHVLPLQPDLLTVRSDSELLVKQMRGEYRVKDPKLLVLHAAARRLAAGLPQVVFEHVPREENRAADALANLAMDRQESSGPLPAALRALPPPAGPVTGLPSL